MSNLPMHEQNNSAFNQNYAPGTIQPSYLECKPDPNLSSKEKKTILVDVRIIKGILKYPFPYRYKVYKQAQTIYEQIIGLCKHIPKDVRNILGTSMVSYIHNLMRETHRTNNEDDPNKRIKGWKTCVDLLQAVVSDIMICKYYCYGENNRLIKLLSSTYNLTKAYLNLITTENYKIYSNGQYITQEDREKVSKEIACLNSIIENGSIDSYIPNYQNKAPAMNVGKKPYIDPNKNNNVTTNGLSQISESYGIPINDLVEGFNKTNSELVKQIKDNQHPAYTYFVSQMEQARQNKAATMSECNKLFNIDNLSRSDDIHIQHSYNIQNGLVDKGKICVVQKDYLVRSRIAHFKNDVPQARANFEKKVAFKTPDCL